jgi:tetratricopeptide (TPR) repeat protein
MVTLLCSGQNPQKLAEAEALIRQGNWDAGIALIERVLARSPRSPQAHNLMGIALTGKGNSTAAAKEYRAALRIQPNFVPALKNLAINELTQNETDAASRHFAAAMKLSPQDPVIHAYLGKIAYARNDYASSAQHLNSTGDLKNDPTVASLLIDSELHLGNVREAKTVANGLEVNKIAPAWQFRIGLVLAQHGLFEEAIPFFQAVNAQRPSSYDAAYNLAICQFEQKQVSAAAETLRAMIDRGLNNAEANVLLAEAYEAGGQTQQAIDALREAVRLAPENEDSYVNLAALCTKYESYDLALQVIEAGLHYHPNSDRLILQRGVIYASRSQLDLADQDFQRASQLAPDKTLGDAALGVSYMQAGNYPKAIEILRERLQLKPKDALLQFFLGQALIRSGAAPGDPTFAEAKAAMEKSVQLNPKYPDSRVDLAKLYLKESRWNDALLQLEQARALDPKNKGVYLTLAIAYRRMGKPERAAEALASLNRLNEEERKDLPRPKRLRVAGDDPALVPAKP